MAAPVIIEGAEGWSRETLGRGPDFVRAGARGSNSGGGR